MCMCKVPVLNIFVLLFQYLMKLCKNLKGGLQEVADQLELRRVGPQHQAGSDSHLTGMAFFKIKEVFNLRSCLMLG